jgi:hypothetical protein
MKMDFLTPDGSNIITPRSQDEWAAFHDAHAASDSVRRVISEESVHSVKGGTATYADVLYRLVPVIPASWRDIWESEIDDGTFWQLDGSGRLTNALGGIRTYGPMAYFRARLGNHDAGLPQDVESSIRWVLHALEIASLVDGERRQALFFLMAMTGVNEPTVIDSLAPFDPTDIFPFLIADIFEENIPGYLANGIDIEMARSIQGDKRPSHTLVPRAPHSWKW